METEKTTESTLNLEPTREVKEAPKPGGFNPTSKGTFKSSFQATNSGTYSADVLAIQKQIGDLEHVRAELGLSRRKMCQLLMVDPSAWTRWMQNPPPAQVWRTLQLYLMVQEKIPGLTPNYFIGGDRGVMEASITQKLVEFEKKLQLRDYELSRLRIELTQKEKSFQRSMWIFAMGTLFIAGIFVLKMFRS